MKAIIIGAGVAGLATALRLRKLGLEVHVYESSDKAGGKLNQIELNGFRFDAGPSLFTFPYLVDELFELYGLTPKAYFQYEKKEVCCHYFWEDGTTLKAYANKEQLADEVHQQLGEERSQILNYLGKAEEKYNTVGDIFLTKSLHRLQTWLDKDVLKAFAKIPSFDLNRNIHQVNKKAFNNPKLVQLFDRYATYNGSNPYQAPGLLTMIPHLEFNIGTFFPKGGMYAITQSLYQLALSQGIQFSFNSKVDEIILENGIATGVRVGEQIEQADIVVSNMDIYPTYKKLLPKVPPPTKTLKQERSSSAMIFYWGINRSFPELDLHNIFFAENYKDEFEHIFKQKTLYSDPTIYIHISSKSNAEDAPEGCENWFILVNTPTSDISMEEDEFVAYCRATVVRKLSRMLKTDISSLIKEESVLTPWLIEKKTSSYLGALYGTSSNNPFAAFMRHPNFSRKIENLYFCGGSVHPGGGIPLCLNSAKIVASLVKEYIES